MMMHGAPQANELQAKLFRGLGEPSRLSILTALRDGPRTVSEIVDATGLGQPNASNHLACLRECGLVTGTQEGRYVRYALADSRVAALLDLGQDVVADVARGMYECTHPAMRGRKRD